MPSSESAPRSKPIDMPCPTCLADIGDLCLRLTPGRYSHIDGYHKARRDLAEEENHVG